MFDRPLTTRPHAIACALVASVVLALGCYAKPDDEANGAKTGSSAARVCGTVPQFAAGELATPEVSFDTEVLPILVASCGEFTACHSSKVAGANHGLFLKPKSEEEIKKVKAALAAPSKTLPAMPFVTPGEPENSFLMRKMDGDLCSLDERCEDGDCGKSMPSGNDTLDAESRNVVRRWIAQGAK